MGLPLRAEGLFQRGSVGAKIVVLLLRSTMTVVPVFGERDHHPLLRESAGVGERQCRVRVLGPMQAEAVDNAVTTVPAATITPRASHGPALAHKQVGALATCRNNEC